MYSVHRGDRLNRRSYISLNRTKSPTIPYSALAFAQAPFISSSFALCVNCQRCLFVYISHTHTQWLRVVADVSRCMIRLTSCVTLLRTIRRVHVFTLFMLVDFSDGLFVCLLFFHIFFSIRSRWIDAMRWKLVSPCTHSHIAQRCHSVRHRRANVFFF